VDSLYQEGGPAQEVRFNSDSYFELVDRMPGIATYLSLGRDLIVTYDGTAYKIIDDTG
jgi:hypothetical protein